MPKLGPQGTGDATASKPPEGTLSTEWKRGMLSADTGVKDKTPIPALVSRNLAIHPTIKHPKLWGVSHTLTGLLFTVVESEDNAKLVAEALNDDADLQDALLQRSKDGIKQKVPSWIALWLKNCQEAKKLDNP